MAPKSEALEARIAKFRPRTNENQPASGGTLWHLNKAGLLEQAIDAQEAKDESLIVTKLTAWEVMADAQRAGVEFKAAA